MRKDKDVLAKTVEKVWLQLEDVKFANIWEQWCLVLDLIIKDKGGDSLVETGEGSCFVPKPTTSRTR